MEALAQLELARLGLGATPSPRNTDNAMLGASSGSTGSLPYSAGSAGAADRPRTGKGSRGPRPRLFKKGACQADGCSADLSTLPRYHLRNHICPAHKSADSFFKQGAEVRFCQRCGVAHPMAEFDGLKKSCRKQLEAHNNRRRKTTLPTAATPAAPAGAPPAAAAAAAAAAASPQPQQEQVAAAPQLLLPVVQLEAGALLAGADVAGADWDTSLDASPEVSVGSAGLPEDPASWLLADTGSGGGIPPPDPAAPLLPWVAAEQQREQQQQQLSGAGMELALTAAPCADAADQRVCCGTACGRCGGCLAVASVPAGLAARPCPAAPPATAVAAAVAGHVGSAAPLPADGASCSYAVPAADAHDTADSRPRAVMPPPAAAHAAGAAAAAAGRSSPAPAAAALEQLQQQNAALYQMFVQQQLLAAQTLLAAAGAVLTSRLPQSSGCSVSAR